MYIRSGEWVIISRGKFTVRLKDNIFKNLRFRVFLVVMLAGLIPGSAALLGIVKVYETRAVALRTAEIQNQCTIVTNQMSTNHYFSDTSSEVINSDLIQLTNIYNGRVMVIDEDLNVVKDTYGLDEGRMDVSENVIRCSHFNIMILFVVTVRAFSLHAPVTEIGSRHTIGVMVASVSTDSIEDSIHILYTQGGLIIGLCMILLAIVAVIFADRVVRPLRKITSAIENVSAGYSDDILHVDTYTETKNISESINKMMGRLKLLDDSREEFVSNVSHELKTPMTSMKVLADSLLEQENVPVEMYQEFMGDIAKEIDRENKIITDLLSLVKMDKKGQTLNIESMNINNLLEQILKRLRPIAQQKNVEIVMESFRPVTAEIDETKFSLAISNLVENAIKYNRDNGWVHVSLNADHKFFYIKVEDSGIGIPEEDQAYIFERFYRVDKSHSREIGGTGLGLAIARNAVIVHRGSIKVYSAEGEGTTFTVRIPLIYAAS